MRHLICALLLCFASPFALAALDLNTATEAELDALPGVGPSRAQAIIEYRRTHGDFASVDDLGKVKGIGDKTLAELKPLLTAAGARGAIAQSPSAPPRSGGAAPSGFPWWILIAGVVAAVVAVVFMLRRSASASTQAAAPAASPVADRAAGSAPAPIATPGSVPKSAPPPRPAASAPAQTPIAAAPSATPPPRPAGGPATPVQAAAPASLSPSAPKPAGAPPKPAGSR